jgi:hypothetical protein
MTIKQDLHASCTAVKARRSDVASTADDSAGSAVLQQVSSRASSCTRLSASAAVPPARPAVSLSTRQLDMLLDSTADAAAGAHAAMAESAAACALVGAVRANSLTAASNVVAHKPRWTLNAADSCFQYAAGATASMHH